MKFVYVVKIYGVNDDGTVTISYENASGKYDYIRASARFSVLKRLEELERGTDLKAKFGICFMRKQGLVLQLIDFELVQNG